MKKQDTRVLFDTRYRNWDQNPFVSLLAESFPRHTKAIGFSWTRALLGNYDLIHLHWPEYLTKYDRWYLRWAARLLTALWILRIFAFRIPVIRTVHNKEPHDNVSSQIDSLLLNLLAKSCRAEVWMQEPSLSGFNIQTKYSVIPHGDYRPWIERSALPPSLALTMEGPVRQSPLRLLCFGILKAYKNIEEPLLAVRDSADLDVSLRILGAAPDHSYVEVLRAHAENDARIEIVPGRVPDSELVSAILSSNFVVVPYPDLFNSGVVLLSLSLQRPVVLRENPIALSLRQEFGAEWVHTYPDKLDATVLRGLLSAPNCEATTPVWGEWRSWRSIGQRHSELYEQHLQ